MKTKLLIAILASSFLSLSYASECGKEDRAYQEGLNYFHEGHYLLASQIFSQVRLFGNDSCGYSFRSSYFQSASLIHLNDVKAFELSHQGLLQSADRDEEKERIILLRAYAYELPVINGTNESLKQRWQLWNTIDDEKNFKKNLKFSDLKNSEVEVLHEKYHRAHSSKKAWIAGGLSALLPGAGQAYVGAYQSAVLAFAFNALLLGTTLEFSRRDLDVAAFTSGTLFSMTYLGNIVSAVKGATQINESASAPYKNQLRVSILPELEF